MKTKNHYQRYIAEYTQRSNRHKKAIRNIGKKLKLWKEQIKRIEKKEEKMILIKKYIIEYFGSIDAQTIGRSVFFKYCIENGINGCYVAQFLKVFPSTPARARLIFTRSFKTKKENRESWHRFNQFIKKQNP